MFSVWDCCFCWCLMLQCSFFRYFTHVIPFTGMVFSDVILHPSWLDFMPLEAARRERLRREEEERQRLALECLGFKWPKFLQVGDSWRMDSPDLDTWLGSPPFISHYLGHLEGDPGPILKGDLRSPWFLTTSAGMILQVVGQLLGWLFLGILYRPLPVISRGPWLHL